MIDLVEKCVRFWLDLEDLGEISGVSVWFRHTGTLCKPGDGVCSVRRHLGGKECAHLL